MLSSVATPALRSASRTASPVVSTSIRTLSTSPQRRAQSTGAPGHEQKPRPGTNEPPFKAKDPREFNPKDTAWKQRKSAFLGISPIYAAFGTISVLAIGAYINHSMKDTSHERPRTGVPHSDELKEVLGKK
ncbi:hypothetical protein JCM10212_005648 [Sporobolomyces blumeae]